jgi:hypothetical protein
MQIKRHSGGAEPAGPETVAPPPEAKKRKKPLRIREGAGGASRVVFDDDGVGIDTFSALARDDSVGSVFSPVALPPTQKFHSCWVECERSSRLFFPCALSFLNDVSSLLLANASGSIQGLALCDDSWVT